jgi:oligopeptide/dipeptide ABC transporter ATP-binding protein
MPLCYDWHLSWINRKVYCRQVRIIRVSGVYGGVFAAVVLLEMDGLVKHYQEEGFAGRGGRKVRAVDGVNLALNYGEAVGLVGESGCGKSTLGRLAVGLERPTAGVVRFMGRPLAAHGAELQDARRHLQIIFQDHTASLDPRWKVAKLIEEPLRNYGVGDRAEISLRAAELLEMVGLEPLHTGSYPHQLSGGQRQRVNIARALALNPKLIVCDEPVSSLDVSIRAQILNLLRDLRESQGLAYLFVSHDLAAVGYLADRVAVMYLGKLVEVLPAEKLVNGSRHPYTRALLAAVPGDPALAVLPEAPLSGEPPDPGRPPGGCRFHPRCPRAAGVCVKEEPELLPVDAEHMLACHLAD